MLKIVGIVCLILVVTHPAMSDNTPPKGVAAMTITKNKQTYDVIPFSRLFFKYQPPMDIEHADGTITKKSDKPMEMPADIRAFHGKQVAIKGFIMPLDSDGERVKSFLLVDQLVTCLFCQGLGMDQWVMVNVNNPKGVKIKDEDYESPITVYGTIDIGEKQEDGLVVSIYRMTADGVEIPHKGLFNVL